jgi:hypothetical protein
VGPNAGGGTAIHLVGVLRVEEAEVGVLMLYSTQERFDLFDLHVHHIFPSHQLKMQLIHLPAKKGGRSGVREAVNTLVGGVFEKRWPHTHTDKQADGDRGSGRDGDGDGETQTHAGTDRYSRYRHTDLFHQLCIIDFVRFDKVIHLP